MKKIFPILLLIMNVCASKVYATTQDRNCTYKFKLTNNSHYPYEQEADKLYYEIRREMEKKSYELSDDNNALLDFEFITGDPFGHENTPYIIEAKYNVRLNIIDPIINDPHNKPYLPDASEILWHLEKSYALGKANKTISAISFSDALNQMLNKIPDCSNIMEKALSKVKGSISKIKATVAARMDLNSNFVAELNSDYTWRNQYCVIDYTSSDCKSIENDDSPGNYHGICESEVKFKINGDPRIFNNTVEMGGFADDGFGRNMIARIVVNVPLIGIPKLVGGLLARTVAKNSADRELEDFLGVFKRCQ